MIKVTRSDNAQTAINPYQIVRLSVSDNGGTNVFLVNDFFQVRDEYVKVIEQFEFWMKAYNLKP